MSSLRKRILMMIATTVVGASVGVLAGFLLGRALTLRNAATRLEGEAVFAINTSVAYSRDAHAALDAMNISQQAPCSHDDMWFLTRLLYSSHLLKEVGRMQDNRILCSTALGVLTDRDIRMPQPDSTGADGVRVYHNLPLFQLSNVTVTTLQFGSSYVVLNPYINSLRSPVALHTRITVLGPNRKASGNFAELPGLPALNREGDEQLAGHLYSTRCAFDYNTCITEYLTVQEALQSDQPLQRGYLIVFSTAGALLGFLFSLTLRRNQDMGRQLRRAIQFDQLVVLYQPIVEIPTRRIVGAEALVRWTNEDNFPVSPEIFIRIAEERGFVGEVTRLVLHHALRDFAETLRHKRQFRVNINVATADLSDPAFLPMLDAAVHRAGVAPQSIAIEITEGSTARKAEVKETIFQLRHRGYSVEIDDFGTGYSSLAYLQELTVDTLKIDRAFTQAIGTQAVTVGILPQILAMADSLDLQVIVEGIETEEQAAYFLDSPKMRCAQGWLYGRPVPANVFQQMLAAEHELDFRLIDPRQV